MKISLFFLFLLAGLITFAQNDNIWVFGDKAGIDFNIQPPQPILTQINALEGCASLCDLNGQLLFYTNGTTVWNRNHDTMPNGSNVVGISNFASRSTSQGVAIVPVQSTLYKYYLFSLGSHESGNQFGKLYYSIIDMSLDGELGDVYITQRGILLDSMLTEHMTTVEGNNCDIWLIALSRKDSMFRAYNINANGINPNPVISPALGTDFRMWMDIFGNTHYHYEQTRGYIDISPDRRKLAIAKDDVSLYDFDLNTGKITNPLLILDSGALAYGVAFSHDNSKLYVQNVREGSLGNLGIFKLMQYDLTNYNIDAIKESAKVISTLTSSIISVNAGALKRAVDGKIYCSPSRDNVPTYNLYPYLDVIHKPNLPGLACQYDSAGFPLLAGTRAVLGLPNNNAIFTIKKNQNYRSFHDTIPCIGYYNLSALDTSGTGYLWNDGIRGHTRLIDSPGTYWVRYIALGTQCTEEFVDTFHIKDIDNRAYHYSSQQLSICWMDSITLRAKNTNGSHYIWDNAHQDSIRSVTASGTYWVRYIQRNPTCNAFIDSFILTDIPMQNQYTYTDKEVCWQDSAILNPSHLNGIGYTWNDATTGTEKVVFSPGYYSISYYDTTTCTRHVDSFYVFIPNQKFNASFSINDSIVCQNHPVQVNNTSDSYYNQFTWFWGTGDTTNFYQPGYNYQHAGSYTVMLVASRNGICPDSVRNTIIVDTQGIASFEVLPRSLCAGSPVNILYSISDSSLHSLSWDYGDGSSIVTKDTILQHAYDQSGTIYITVEATFRACPPDSYTDSVIVHPFPLVDLGADSAICIQDNPVILQNQSPVHNDYNYYWNTGDTTSTLKVLQPGRYSLTVVDKTSGCQSSEFLIVHKDCYTDIPNAFTPNGDGVNDYFYPRRLLARGVNRFHMQVFNRWGQLLFTTHNPYGRGWDGYYNGQMPSEGVYVYLIEIEWNNGEQERYEGNVTLIR